MSKITSVFVQTALKYSNLFCLCSNGITAAQSQFNSVEYQG